MCVIHLGRRLLFGILCVHAVFLPVVIVNKKVIASYHAELVPHYIEKTNSFLKYTPYKSCLIYHFEMLHFLDCFMLLAVKSFYLE